MTGRILAQFSCGAPSAVATKLAIADHGSSVEVINAFIAEEHPDNRRFLSDAEKWIGQSVRVVRDEKYNASALEVFHRVGVIKTPKGATCTSRIKRGLLKQYEQPGDVLVLGFTAEEADRAEDFAERNPDRPFIAPLIERGLTRSDCKGMVERAGLELPLMYRMGYDNANCIGCVKGGIGYWRAIREDFPERFEEVAQAEDHCFSLHGQEALILRHRSGPLAGQRFRLRELPAGEIHRSGDVPECGVMCAIAEQEYSA